MSKFHDLEISKESSVIIDSYCISDLSEGDFYYTVKGDSMREEFPSGCKVSLKVLKKHDFIQWGKVYALNTSDSGIMLKRLEPSEDLESIVLSDNTSYQSITIKKSDIVALARVIGVIIFK